MKKINFLFFLMLCSCLISAQSSSTIPYQIAKRYFVKNTYQPNSLKNPKIQSQEQFREIFGMATVMGKDGQPTVIDFNTQYVIAIIKDETTFGTTITPLSLTKNSKGIIELNVEVREGKSQSYRIVPTLILVVDKQHQGRVVVKEQFVK
ncbi:hypothetical protein [Arcicella rigui]|uniref:Uncharacterized protein n=1 Tax=Arcicella rigui TaxID=797020 RepID=A0ABU5QEP6_9BACT|nr:hypothetical protein [Arcicella rigui]MEA5141333.1 hypothetical protein [Arcicella rigui]